MNVSVLLLSLISAVGSPAPANEHSDGDLPSGLTKYEMVVHDPVMIQEEDRFYLFTTGPGVTVWSSDDLEHWDREPQVFDPVPAWAKEEVPGFNGHIWAPDICYRDGLFYLYYSVSAFGKNTSCIGVATNKTLDRESEDFEWVDHGIVLQSFPGLNDWNAIDPNYIEDVDGTPYMSFGSFWTGLKLVQLSEDRLSLADPEDPAFVGIASRRTERKEMPEGGYSLEPGDDQIEGPFIAKKDDYYYLFISTGLCCRGSGSTYRMEVGRSKDLLGPYLDADGVPLMESGGTLVLAGDERWHGVGHNGYCSVDGTDYLVFHGYDATSDQGLPKFHIEPIVWTEDGWPTIVQD